MKTSKIFVVAAIALGFMACNKNEDINVPQEEAQATLSVKISSGTLRALGAPDDSDPVKNFEVYVFKGQVLEGYKRVEGAMEAKEIEVSAGNATLAVVANAGGEGLGKAFTLDELKEAVKEGVIEDAGGLLMTSEMKEISIKAGKNLYGYTKTGDENEISADPLALVRVPARVVLQEAKTEFSGTFEGWTLEPQQVFVFNVRGKSKLFGDNLYMADAPFYSGVDLGSFSGDLGPAASEKHNSLQDEISSFEELPELPAYFYTYENEDAAHPVVLTIKGLLKDADGELVKNSPYTDAEGTTYYSILVNVTKQGYSYEGDASGGNGKVKRNTEYKLHVTIKRPGKDNPIVIPSDPATLDVKVVVTPWTVVNQNVTY
ncbi:hypothetical protein HQ29_05110 [Porphyromonas canoris]|uniref:fimbrial protein n=1 Tax=Porphyromonas canoris TaxID=36875 RepID=UPI00051DA8EA|nr:fimbrial protein [Porphyromonas canoris]KGL52991.1 hypothetical protein HQ29_05110 [Porphyromonas canoris]